VVDFESAAADRGVSIDAKEAEIEEKAPAYVGFLGAETALAQSQSIGDIGSEDFAKRFFVAVENAGVIAVLELEERRMPQHLPTPDQEFK
jgi:hypothetical protein